MNLNDLPGDTVMTLDEFRRLDLNHKNEEQKKRYRCLTVDEKRAKIEKYSRVITCEVCETEILSTSVFKHNLTKKHIENFNRKNPDKEQKVYDKKNHESDWYKNLDPEKKKALFSKKYFCEICNKDVTASNKSNHFKSEKHKKLLR